MLHTVYLAYKYGDVDPVGGTVCGAPRFRNPQRMSGGPAYTQNSVISWNGGDRDGPSHNRWDRSCDPV
jgi:hypothetical protein